MSHSWPGAPVGRDARERDVVRGDARVSPVRERLLLREAERCVMAMGELGSAPSLNL